MANPEAPPLFPSFLSWSLRDTVEMRMGLQQGAACLFTSIHQRKKARETGGRRKERKKEREDAVMMRRHVGGSEGCGFFGIEQTTTIGLWNEQKPGMKHSVIRLPSGSQIDAYCLLSLSVRAGRKRYGDTKEREKDRERKAKREREEAPRETRIILPVLRPFR